MKRHSESPWKEGREKAARRQDPVSCQFCRAKKLKCDRAQPCSNCRSRAISCISAHAPTASQAVHDSSDDTTPVNGAQEQPIVAQKNLNLADIDARLRRVERLVLANDPSHLQSQSAGLGRNTQRSLEPLSQDFELLSRDCETENARSHEQEDLGDDEELSKRAVLLENAAISQYPNSSWGTSKDTTAFIMTDEVFIEKLGATLLVSHSADGSADELKNSQLLSGLPPWKEAVILFDHYVNYVNWIYHIIHVPLVANHLEDIYLNIEHNIKPNTTHLALIYAILSLSAYFGSSLAGLGMIGTERKPLSRRWSSFAVHALAEARKSSPICLETLQTVTLLSTYVLPNIGASALNVILVAMIMSSARMLGLHQTDSKSNRKDREKNGYNAIELEEKRRLWWYITSSDWIMSYMSGPQSGTYLVNPKHMNVQFPCNVDDAALTPSQCNDSPLSVPTEMSYFIFRIKGAQLFREVVDAASESNLHTDDLDYERILAFDRKFNDLIDKELPSYYKMDENSQRQSSQIVRERPYIAWQRILMHFGFHTRLARLHRPYLARGSRQSRYAYSRMVCLRSSRTVIEIARNMYSMDPAFGPGAGQIWMVIHHLFVAIVVLVMDLTFNQSDPQAKERKNEVVECCKLLEKSSEESAIARQGVEELKRVLKNWKQKNKSWPERTDPENMPENLDRHLSAIRPLSLSDPMTATGASLYVGPFSNGAEIDQSYGFQDLLPTSFEFDPSFDCPQWTELFQGLENYSEPFE